MKRILCFGDSNTWGAIPGSSERYADEVRWTGVLQRELGEDYIVINEGYNGRTTVFDDPVENRLSGIRYFGPCLDTQSPLDLVCIMLGTNDMKQRFGVNAETIACGFQRYLDAVQTTPMAGSKPKILLIAPIEISPAYRRHVLFHDMFGDNAAEKSKKLSDACRRFAEVNDLEFFDAASYGTASDIDGIHMDPESHERIGKALAEKIRSLKL